MAANAENAPGNWGLIAGNGDFPFLVLEGARSRGIEMAVIAIREEASPALEQRGQAAALDQLGRVEPRHRIAASRGRETRGDGRAGKTQQNLQLDSAGLAPGEAVLFSLPSKNTDSLIGAVARVLEDEGIELVDSTKFLGPALASGRRSDATRSRRSGRSRTSNMEDRSRSKLPGSTWGKQWWFAIAPAWPSKPWKERTKPSSAPRASPAASDWWS